MNESLKMEVDRYETDDTTKEKRERINDRFFLHLTSFPVLLIISQSLPITYSLPLFNSFFRQFYYFSTLLFYKSISSNYVFFPGFSQPSVIKVPIPIMFLFSSSSSRYIFYYVVVFFCCLYTYLRLHFLTFSCCFLSFSFLSSTYFFFFLSSFYLFILLFPSPSFLYFHLPLPMITTNLSHPPPFPLISQTAFITSSLVVCSLFSYRPAPPYPSLPITPSPYQSFSPALTCLRAPGGRRGG